MLSVNRHRNALARAGVPNHCAHVGRGRRCLANNAVSVPKPGPIKSLIVVGAIKPTIYPAGIVVAIDAGPIVVGIKSKVSPA
jgi:hypothetical protein